eukprot:613882-Hanusia_phi.AAC.1
MPDYSKSVIYTIRCKNNDSFIYVGSTTQQLCLRWGQHKTHCYHSNNASYNMLLYQEIRKTSWDDWYIELYEEYPCENIQQLHKREGEVIRVIGTLNRNIAGRDDKQWFEDNKEKIREQQKQWREENKEKIKHHREDNKDKAAAYYKQWYEDNKEKLQEYREDNKQYFKDKWQEYYSKNKSELLKKQKEKKECECGMIISNNWMNKHIKTQRHQNYLTRKNDDK